jgi:HSP20 family protein
MRSRFHATVALAAETGDFIEEVRQAFLELGRRPGTVPSAGQCTPPIDVLETDDAVELIVDLPDVDAASIRVVSKGNALLIAGEKGRRPPGDNATFHLVERDFGCFARVVSLGQPCEMSRADARLAHGELRITVPKRAERRRRAVPIPVQVR